MGIFQILLSKFDQLLQHVIEALCWPVFALLSETGSLSIDRTVHWSLNQLHTIRAQITQKWEIKAESMLIYTYYELIYELKINSFYLSYHNCTQFKVRWLLKHDAKIICDKYGKSPINDAAENEQWEVMLNEISLFKGN